MMGALLWTLRVPLFSHLHNCFDGLGLDSNQRTSQSISLFFQLTSATEERIKEECNPELPMAFRALPSFCADAAYQRFLPLGGFPSAKNFCSNLAVHQESNNFAANSDRKGSAPRAAKGRGLPCPAGSSLCSLLSELLVADKAFARNVWYTNSTSEKSMDVALTSVPVAAWVFTLSFPESQCLNSSPPRLQPGP